MHVALGSFYTKNWWERYRILSKYYTHKTVNHSKHFLDSLTDIYINFIKGIWTPIKQNVFKKWRTKKIFCYHWPLKWLKNWLFRGVFVYFCAC